MTNTMLSRLGNAFRNLWLNFAVFITLLLGTEFLAFTYYFATSVLVRRPDPVVRMANRLPRDGYPSSGDDSWFREYAADEFSCTDVDWTSYTYWQRRPCNSKYVNVDAHGRRATWNAASPPAAGSIHIAMFGGSTMWGTGARDEYTIPSYVAKTLAERHPQRFTITNYGEGGYVSTQELILLLREVQAGRVPNIVVFYDGFNDAAAAFQEGVAGVPQNEMNRRREFNILNRARTRDLYLAALATTNTFQLVSSLRRVRWPEPVRTPSTGPDAEALAQDVITVYVRNMEIIRALAQHSGFRCAFFWHPSTFTKEPRTRAEEASRRRWGSMGPFVELVDVTVRTSPALSSLRDFHNLSDVLDGQERTMFIDPAHTTELANEVIAREIVSRLDAHLKEALSVPSEPSLETSR